MLYVDEHDRQKTQTTLADLVASTLTAPRSPEVEPMANRKTSSKRTPIARAG